MNLSSEIKSRVSALDVCRQYGIDVNHAGFTRCLWHNEKTASLKIYPGDRGYFCFGCHASGSSIDLVMKLFGCSVGDACKRLNDDFRLGLIQEGNLSTAERIAQNKAAWERRKREREKEAEHVVLIREWNDAIQHLRLVEFAYFAAAPIEPDDEWSECFVTALKERERARARADEAMQALNDFEKKRFAG